MPAFFQFLPFLMDFNPSTQKNMARMFTCFLKNLWKCIVFNLYLNSLSPPKDPNCDHLVLSKSKSNFRCVYSVSQSSSETLLLKKIKYGP